MTTNCAQCAELARAKKQIADMQSKALKQRQEIARLTRQNEALAADKADLRHDLYKAEARAGTPRV